jgi:hypothetical protein
VDTAPETACKTYGSDFMSLYNFQMLAPVTCRLMSFIARWDGQSCSYERAEEVPLRFIAFPGARLNEVYLRLVDVKSVEWKQRAQFFAIAAQMMRRILVARGSHKRGGGAIK